MFVMTSGKSKPTNSADDSTYALQLPIKFVNLGCPSIIAKFCIIIFSINKQSALNLVFKIFLKRTILIEE